MKNKKIYVIVTVISVLFSLLIFCIPASASSSMSAVSSAISTIVLTSDSPDYREYVFDDTVSLIENTYEFNFHLASDPSILYNVFEIRSAGLVWYDFSSEFRLDPYFYDEGWINEDYRTLFIDYSTLNNDSLEYLNSNGSFVVDDSKGMYNDLYNIFVEFVYGGVELTPDMRFTATLFSSIVSVLTVAFPFIIAFWVAKFILNFMR